MRLFSGELYVPLPLHVGVPESLQWAGIPEDAQATSMMVFDKVYLASSNVEKRIAKKLYVTCKKPFSGGTTTLVTLVISYYGPIGRNEEMRLRFGLGFG
jgi:hypothetical protein